eukprot:4952208-Pleurochrysis_carterae.AAC.1
MACFASFCTSRHRLIASSRAASCASIASLAAVSAATSSGGKASAASAAVSAAVSAVSAVWAVSAERASVGFDCGGGKSESSYAICSSDLRTYLRESKALRSGPFRKSKAMSSAWSSLTAAVARVTAAASPHAARLVACRPISCAALIMPAATRQRRVANAARQRRVPIFLLGGK